MAKLLNWLGILALFGGWIAVIASRYETERVMEVEKGINPFAALLIGVVILVGISFLMNNFKGKIYNDPFGRFAVTLYSVAFLGVAAFIYIAINSISKAAENNVATFTENMAYHADTLWYLMMVSLLALAISWIALLKHVSEKIAYIYHLIKK